MTARSDKRSDGHPEPEDQFDAPLTEPPDWPEPPPMPDYPDPADVLDPDDAVWFQLEASSGPPPTNPSRAAFGSENADQLSNDVPRSDDATAREQHIGKARDLHLLRVEDDNSRRSMFFKFAIWITAIPVFIACIVMGVTVIFREPSDAVLISFFASVVLQAIGLSAIIARYLFPNGGNDEKTLPGDKP